MTIETDLEALHRLLDGVAGWLSHSEALLLCELAQEVEHGKIVEIGSYHGRSTIALAYGAYKSQSIVYAIDPHHAHIAGDYLFSPSDLHPFMENLLRTNLAKYVRIINLPSMLAVASFDEKWPIDLVWIDGAHDYLDVKDDFNFWGDLVSKSGKIAVHDYTAWEAPTRVVDEALTSGDWEIDRQVDFIVVLKRAVS